MVNGTAPQSRPHVSEEEAAFLGLYDDALSHVYGYLLRRCGDSSTAEDLTQEVFLTAARTARQGHVEKLSIAWLLTAARSRLVDHYRARHRHERKLAMAWSAGVGRDDEVIVADAASVGAVESRTTAALDELAPMQRAALVLRHMDGLSVAEVAEMLGRSVRATESLLARAKRGFRVSFEEASDA